MSIFILLLLPAFVLQGSLVNYCSLDSHSSLYICSQAPYEECEITRPNHSISQAPKCEHKSIFPQYAKELVGAGLLTFGLALCNAGGVGGGTVLTPILILLGNFRQTEAVALANFVILLGAILRFFQNWKERHPERENKVAIDYNLILILMPMTLLGTTLGVLINTTFPDGVVLIFMTIFFVSAAGLTIQKGVQRCRKENNDRKKRKFTFMSLRQLQIQSRKNQQERSPRRESERRSRNRERENGKEQEGLRRRASNEPINHEAEVISSRSNSNSPQEHQHHIKEDDIEFKQPLSMRTVVKYLQMSQHCVWYKVLPMWVMLVSLIIIEAIRNNLGQPCNATNIVLLFTLVVIAILNTLVGAVIVLKEDRQREQQGYQFLKSEFRLSSCKRVLFLAIIALIGTAVATAIGSGGGTIYSPMLLFLGLPPSVTASTAIYLILYKSIATVVQFAIKDLFLWQYALYYGIFAIIGTIFISSNIQRCMKDRQSVLIITIAIIVIIGAILTPIVSIYNGSSNQWEFADLCEI